MTKLTIGIRLKQLRKLFGFSQLDVAKILGVDRSAYCCYEINRAKPDIYNLARLARLYHVSTDYLLFGGQGADALPDGEQEHPATILDENLLTLSPQERALIIQLRILPDRDEVLEAIRDKCAEYLKNEKNLFPDSGENIALL